MKKCLKCLIEKPLTEFHKSSRPNSVHSYCKKCNIANRMKHYYAHKTEHHEHQKSARKALREKLWSYLSDFSCVDCGEKDVVVLEFDHLRDKRNGVARMVNGLFSWENILEEISKCEVVCCNCHRRRTAKRAGWQKEAFRKK